MQIRYFFILLSLVTLQTVAQSKIAGPKTILPGIQDGYVLLNPTNYKKAYLIDNCGRIVNTWQSQYAAAHTMYLKPNGSLVRTNLLANTIVDGGGGSGGGVEILDWNSTLLWSYAYNTDKVRQHHDISVLPNGNVLLLAWEVMTQAESMAAGRNPALIPDGQVWPEHLIEVKPIVPNSGEIVWEWHAKDHLIQDFDASKTNYGVVAAHPELIDFNFTVVGQKDWIHSNAIDYNQQLDQIIISAHSFNEIWIIDHSTTSAQASLHAGGHSNKGGDLLYRWGNPQAYRQGTAGDAKLFGQHNPHWIPPGLPDEGKIIVFNNGPDRLYSTVEIISPPLTSAGLYTLTGNTYGPATAYRIYPSPPQTSFFSRIMGSAQVLANGNLFIGSSLQGRTIEVNPANQTLWEYKSPITASGIVGRDYFPTNPNFASTPIFRSTKYSGDYPAFNGRILTPQEPIEGEPWAACTLVTGLGDEPGDGLKIYPNPVDDLLQLDVAGSFSATLFDGQGKKVFDDQRIDHLSIETSGLPAGLYLLRVNNRTHKVIIIH